MLSQMIMFLCFQQTQVEMGLFLRTFYLLMNTSVPSRDESNSMQFYLLMNTSVPYDNWKSSDT